MSAKEITMVEKMLFIEAHKEIFKDNILERVGSESIALLLFNMLLDNKKITDTVEYQRLLQYLKTAEQREQRDTANVYVIIGVIKSYVSKAYSGHNEFYLILNKLNAYESVFTKFEELNVKQKVMTIRHSN